MVTCASASLTSQVLQISATMTVSNPSSNHAKRRESMAAVDEAALA
jgi:hypothetical protein